MWERKREFSYFGIEVVDFHITCKWVTTYMLPESLEISILLDIHFPSFYLHCFVFSSSLPMSSPCCISPIMVDGTGECVYVLIYHFPLHLLASVLHSPYVYVFLILFLLFPCPYCSNIILCVNPISPALLPPACLFTRTSAVYPKYKWKLPRSVKYLCNDVISFGICYSFYSLLSPMHILTTLFPFAFLSSIFPFCTNWITRKVSLLCL